MKFIFFIESYLVASNDALVDSLAKVFGKWYVRHVPHKSFRMI